MSVRNILATHTGPGRLRLRLPDGQVVVAADPVITHAEVVLIADTPEAADLVARTEVGESGDELTITVPKPSPITLGGGRGGGRIGGLLPGLRRAAKIAISGGPLGATVHAQVRVPERQRVDITTASAPVLTLGRLTDARIHTSSGAITVEVADRADLHAQHDITVGSVGKLQADSSFGEIRVTGRMDEGTLTAQHDITVARVGDLRADSSHGEIRITAARAAEVRAQHDISVDEATNLNARSSHGEIRVTGRVSGSAVLHADHDITVSEVKTLRADSSNGAVSVTRMGGGTIRAQHDITIAHLNEDTDLRSSYGAIDAHVASPVELRAHAQHDLTITAAPGVPIDRSTLRSAYGDIHLSHTPAPDLSALMFGHAAARDHTPGSDRAASMPDPAGDSPAPGPGIGL